MGKILYIVIPCYNEEEVLEETTKQLSQKLDIMIKNNIIDKESKIMYINDGSKDKTWDVIVKLYEENKYVEGINLLKNMGQQNALYAGLMTAKRYADIVISMDSDMQDDINILEEFINEYNKGAEIVYGVRTSRKKDSWFKRNTAIMFYKILKFLGVDIVYNHADYRLMSKKALDVLEEYKEVNLFLRGVVSLIGLKSSIVKYERKERIAGKTKYSIKKMVNFALDGILSFSVKPIRIITLIGFCICAFSLIFFMYVLISHFSGGTIKGWTTTILLICLFGGFQIFCIGIIGEYIGKVYSETKARPRYLIQEELKK